MTPRWKRLWNEESGELKQLAPARHDEIAEKIIRTEGLIFALASGGGKEGDLREARGYLKSAIVKALESEWQRGANAGLSSDI